MKRTRYFLSAFALAGLMFVGLPTSSYAQWETDTAGAEAAMSAMQDAAAQDIVSTLEARGNFTVLVSALKQTGLGAQLESGDYTLFAPTDAAFSGVAVESLSPNTLAVLLRNHLVPKALASEELATAGSVTTVAGNSLTASSSGGGVTIGNATVTEADIQASNGVIHVVDTVLQPAASTSMAPQDTSASY